MKELGMIWTCFAAIGPGDFVGIETILDAKLFYSEEQGTFSFISAWVFKEPPSV